MIAGQVHSSSSMRPWIQGKLLPFLPYLAPWVSASGKLEPFKEYHVVSIATYIPNPNRAQKQVKKKQMDGLLIATL